MEPSDARVDGPDEPRVDVDQPLPHHDAGRTDPVPLGSGSLALDGPVEVPPDATTSAWDSPRLGRLVLAIGLAGCIVVWLRFGLERWFLADDWSYVLYRDVLHPSGRLATRLFVSMNGHPVAVPAVLISLLGGTFGWSSYAPFVVLSVGLWTSCCLAVFALLRHCGFAPVTSAVVTIAAATTGAATEIPTMASIANFELSLLTALVALLIVERRPDSPTTWISLGVLGVLSAMSSALGPILMVAPTASAMWQRRTVAAVTASAPAMATFGWWWVAYGRDRPTGSSTVTAVPEFVATVAIRTFDALVGFDLGVVALLACLTLGMVGPTVESRRVGRSLAGVALVALAVIGWRRAELGDSDVEIGRYVAVVAVLLAPLLAAVVDRARTIARTLWLALLVVLIATTSGNLRHWRDGQVYIIDANRADRATLELLAGADVSGLDPEFRPSPCSVEVQVRHLAGLVDRGVLEPRVPDDDDERALLEATLALARGEQLADDPRPCTG